MLRRHHQRLGLLFELRFRSWAFDIDLAPSRQVFLLTVLVLPHGHGEWREWEFLAPRELSTQA